MLNIFPVAVAYAEASTGAVNPMATGIASFFPFIVLIVVFYFLLIRPQQQKAKDHTKMIEKLQNGDTIVTLGGLYGKVTNIKDETVSIEISDGVRVKVTKSAVQVRKAQNESE